MEDDGAPATAAVVPDMLDELASVSTEWAVELDVSALAASAVVGVEAVVSLTGVSWSEPKSFMSTSRSFNEAVTAVGAECAEESSRRDESCADWERDAAAVVALVALALAPLLLVPLVFVPVLARFSFGWSLSEGDLERFLLPLPSDGAGAATTGPSAMCEEYEIFQYFNKRENDGMGVLLVDFILIFFIFFRVEGGVVM